MADRENFRIRPAEGVTELREINTESVCPQARYRFDHPVICRPGDYYELLDGQWFLVRHGIGTLIEGKWDRIEP